MLVISFAVRGGELQLLGTNMRNYHLLRYSRSSVCTRVKKEKKSLSVNICKCARHCVVPLHLAASLLCGIKQTEIDLQYDCLLCLAVSDGWRFLHFWKAGEIWWRAGRGRGLKIKLSPRISAGRSVGQLLIILSSRLKWNSLQCSSKSAISILSLLCRTVNNYCPCGANKFFCFRVECLEAI